MWSRPRRGWIRWGGWVLLLALLAAAWAADQRLKHAPHAGHAPDSAWLTLEVADVPEAWARLATLPPGEAARQHLSRTLHEAQLAVYRRAGIRPTPLRWRVWLGAHGLASWSPGGWTMSVRPGLLAHALHRLRVWRGETGPAFAMGDLYYAWHDGDLVIGSDAALVTRDVARLTRATSDPERVAVRVRRPRSGAGALQLRANLAFAIDFDAGAPARPGRTLRLSPEQAQWPLVVALSQGADLPTAAGLALAVGRLIAPESHRAAAAQLLQTWGLQPDALRALDAVGPATLVWLGTRTGAGPPVPQVGLVWQRTPPHPPEHPLHTLLDAPGAPRLSMQWGAFTGEMRPILGSDVALCIAAHGDYAFVTFSEPAAAQLAEALAHTAAPRPGILYARADWSALAQTWLDVSRWAGEVGIQPRAEGPFEVSPLAGWEALAQALGSAEVHVRRTPDGLRLRGRLSAP